MSLLLLLLAGCWLQEWFNSRHKPWNARVVLLPETDELEKGPSVAGQFLFSASPLMQEWRVGLVGVGWGLVGIGSG